MCHFFSDGDRLRDAERAVADAEANKEKALEEGAKPELLEQLDLKIKQQNDYVKEIKVKMQKAQQAQQAQPPQFGYRGCP